MGSVEADDERQISVADDWQLQRLARSSSTNNAAPGDIGGPSEQAYTRPAPGRPASAAQYAIGVTVLDHTSWCCSHQSVASPSLLVSGLTVDIS